MIILQIEHPVQNFDGWKKAFENDPMDRKGSGVKSYRISRLAENKNYVLIELEFDEMIKAEKMLGELQRLWNQVEGKIIQGVKARITEVIESVKY